MKRFGQSSMQEAGSRTLTNFAVLEVLLQKSSLPHLDQFRKRQKRLGFIRKHGIADCESYAK
jgi:hypothetical protein